MIYSYHKGYDVREPIEVRVLPDKVEILSHPGADRSISIDGLKNYRATSRRYRNRRIGEFLKELHLTEGRNTGFQKILRALQNNGSPKPMFETDEDRTYFLSTIFIHPGFLIENDGLNDGLNDRLNDGLTKNEQDVFQIIKQEPTITIVALAKRLKLSETTIERNIKGLKEKGVIIREGSKKKGQWTVVGSKDF